MRDIYKILNEVLIEWNKSSKEDSDNVLLKSEDIKESLYQYARYTNSEEYFNTAIKFTNYIWDKFIPYFKKKDQQLWSIKKEINGLIFDEISMFTGFTHVDPAVKNKYTGFPDKLFGSKVCQVPTDKSGNFINNNDFNGDLNFGDLDDCWDVYDLFDTCRLINSTCKILSSNDPELISFVRLGSTPCVYSLNPEDWDYNYSNELKEFINSRYNNEIGFHIFSLLYKFLDNSPEYIVYNNLSEIFPGFKFKNLQFNQLTGETREVRYFIITNKKRKQFTLCINTDDGEMDKVFFIDFANI